MVHKQIRSIVIEKCGHLQLESPIALEIVWSSAVEESIALEKVWSSAIEESYCSEKRVVRGCLAYNFRVGF